MEYEINIHFVNGVACRVDCIVVIEIVWRCLTATLNINLTEETTAVKLPVDLDLLKKIRAVLVCERTIHIHTHVACHFTKL